MQITKFVQNYTFSVLVSVVLVTMIAFLVNEPDPDLEQRVSDLENRVALIEETLPGTDTIDTSEKEWQNVEIWRQLREGMSPDQVQELLGRPITIDGGTISTWYYSEQRWHSIVRFNRGQVNSWTEPR